SLDKNAECDVYQHAARRQRKGSAADRCKASANNISAHGGGRDKCANRFANPTLPEQLKKPRTIRFGKKNAPPDRVQKNWDQMVHNDAENCPFGRGKGVPDLGDALTNEEPREKRGATKAEQPRGHVYFANCFHRPFERNSV